MRGSQRPEMLAVLPQAMMQVRERLAEVAGTPRLPLAAALSRLVEVVGALGLLLGRLPTSLLLMSRSSGQGLK